MRTGGRSGRRRSRPARRLADRQARARLPRHVHLRLQGRARREGRRDRTRAGRQPLRRGEPDPRPARRARRHGLRSRRRRASVVSRRERRHRSDPGERRHPGAPDEPRRRDRELLVGRPERLRRRSEAGSRRAGPRRAVIDPARDHRVDVLGLRRHLDGDAARRRRSGPPAPAASELGSVAGQVGADGGGRAGVAEHRAHRGGERAPRGRRTRERARVERSQGLHCAAVAFVREDRRVDGGAAQGDAALGARCRRRRRRLDGLDRAAGADRRRADRRAGARDGDAGRKRRPAGRRERSGERRPRRERRLPRPVEQRCRASGSVRVPRRASRAPHRAGHAVAEAPGRRYRPGDESREDVLLSVGPVRACAELRRAADGRERRRAPLLDRHRRARRELRRLRARGDAGGARRPVRARLEGRERRPGLRGHPDRRQLAHLRLEHRRGRGRGTVPAPAALLRLRRLALRPVHRGRR